MRFEKSKREMRTLQSLNDGNKPGSIHPPLLEIQLDHVVTNELYQLLRFTDRLIENLINGAIASS